ncbi:hypothetical protein [Chryseobacterium sp. Bi04]|uniref:hypothetical protein n=1 Tax=Chryseobacterium sp. Bi04 TaxID=2822345 RepID=UPI001E511594|nr:hypothetical protein [Chryseobacterium sp. Bi04]
MKEKLLLIFICILTLFLCKAQENATKNTSIMPFIETYIDTKNKEHTVDAKQNILIVGAHKVENEKEYWVYIYFINPEIMVGFQYSKVYLIRGYKIIIDEFLNKSFLEALFKDLQRLPMQDFNLGKYQYTYNPNMWRIVFNNKNEVILLSPQDKAETIKSILEKKGVKFSKDYQE